MTLFRGRCYGRMEPMRQKLPPSISPPAAKIILIVAALILPLAGSPAEGAVSEKELNEAREQRAALQRKVNAAVTSYEASLAKYEETQIQLARSQHQLETAEQELRSVQGILSGRAVNIYKQGRIGLVSVLLEAANTGEFFRRVVLLEKASANDSATLLRLERVKAEVTESKEDLSTRRAEQQATTKQLQALTSQLTSQFKEASDLEAKLVSQKAEEDRLRRQAEERRRRAAQVARRSSFAPGNFHCPIDGPNSFTDTWGAPRSGGRRHQGVDIYAAHGARVVSVVDGTILRMSQSSLGGISLYLRGGDGTEYFYTHLAGYASISPGQRVSGGQLVAYNGNSGNARGGPAHLHFEIHPGGGAAINPYPTTKAACG